MAETPKILHKTMATIVCAATLATGFTAPVHANESTPVEQATPAVSAENTQQGETSINPEIQRQAEEAQKLLEQDGVATQTDGKETQPSKNTGKTGLQGATPS